VTDPADAAAAAANLRAELQRVMPGMPALDLGQFASAVAAAQPYALGADSLPQDGIACGTVRQARLAGSRIYPGVAHNYWVYVPVGAGAGSESNLLVCLDGPRYLGPEANTHIVLDNLIARGVIPPTVAVFVEAGEPGPGLPIYGGAGNRSVEYDSVDARFARFLLDELLPAATGGLPVTRDPTRRAICGLSSGGNGAFAAAWHCPQQFSAVISHCGSFVDIRGGSRFPALIRSTEPKPLRVFLQTGTRDLNIVFGDWVLANRAMASALCYRGYAHRLVIGGGGHSLAHGGSLLPDALRWIWPASGNT
jgi:enterochelin esterase family protein